MLLPVTPGDRAGEAAVRGRYHTAKVSCRTRHGVSSMTALAFVFKEQQQNKPQLSDDDKWAEL